MLTLIEYLLLLYRALLPTPVWYRFFLNKEYGSLFSSLMTGLYLTFKLTSVVERVRVLSYSFPAEMLFICFHVTHNFLLLSPYHKDRILVRVVFSHDVYFSFPVPFFSCDIVRCNPSLLHWKLYHVKKCTMGHMLHLSRQVEIVFHRIR